MNNEGLKMSYQAFVISLVQSILYSYSSKVNAQSYYRYNADMLYVRTGII